MNSIYEPFSWYVSGGLIALVMLLLLLLGKKFGMSSNLQTVCSALGGGKYASYFRFNWKDNSWSLTVVLGAILGGVIATNFMNGITPVDIHPEAIAQLHALGFQSAGNSFLPTELFDLSNITSVKTILILIGGGFLVGFGARYAGGCTSGHAISGLSNLQLPSLIAVIGFFIGGLFMVHILFPLIF